MIPLRCILLAALAAGTALSSGDQVSLRNGNLVTGDVEAISADGRVIIGHNIFYHGWVVNLCVPDLDGSGAVDFGDLLEVLSFWGESGVEADLD
ncbi:MAG: hypothetical protein HKO57_16910, partial [Akkermansiaceae bacterium]|nr:hypothetical protein [Akkermansiaceae bacterium]